MVKCCSETEASPDKSLVKIPLPWRSDEFSLLAEQLDQIHVLKKTNTKGTQFVQTYTIENLRSPPTAALSRVTSDAPQGLPINCYTSDYIHTLTETQKLLLNPKPPVDWDTLLQMTKTSCE